MKIAFSAKPAADTDLYLLGVTEGSLKKIGGPHAKTIEALLDAYHEFKGAAGEVITTILPGFEYKRFGLLGLGNKNSRDPLSLEKIGGKLSSALISLPVNDAYVNCANLSAQNIAHIASGAALRTYEFKKYITKISDEFISDSLTFSSPASAVTARAFSGLEATARCVHWVRDMCNEPPNILQPETFAAEIVAKLKPLGIKVTVLDEDQLKKMGANAIIAVGQASEHKPRLVLLEYNGTGKKTSRPVALVGKGVTFDTGGYSIQTASGMIDMKTDMAGAAAVAGAFMILAKKRAKVHVVGALAMVENMISDEAYRPSDIIKSLSGQTIEITNTDAEGRLILCDAMWHLQNKYKPRAMVDIATLTGSALIALGEEYAAFFANDNALCVDLIKASHATGDKIWRMPLDEAFNQMMDSNVADMRNAALSRSGGTCTAASFLQRFVHKDVKWAHIDMAPTMVSHGEQALCPAGPTGFGTRLLANWVENYK